MPRTSPSRPSAPRPGDTAILRNIQTPFWLLAVAYGAAFMLPVLMAEGTFFDGEIYATLARNYADGQGTLWSPHQSVTVHPQWHEHPPLGVWIMAGSYLVMGDGLWVEHAHSLLTALVAGWLLVVLWRRLLRDRPQLARLGWLPLLMWLMNPQVTWAYSNAMLENTSTIFVLLALLAVVRERAGERPAWRWAAAAGLAVAAAVLVKGPVGLFALAAPVLGALIVGRPGLGRAALVTLAMTGVVAGVFGLLWLWPEARHALTRYLDTQLIASLSGDRGGNPDLGQLLGNLLETNLVAIGLGAVLATVAWGRRRGAAFAGTPVRLALWMLAVGLAGSVPLGLSQRQSLFYCLPSFPCYALGLALLTGPAVVSLQERMTDGGRAQRLWLAAAAVLLLATAGLGLARVGTYARDGELREDVKIIVAHVTDGLDREQARAVVLGLCANLRHNWTLQTCFNRYGRLAIDRTEKVRPLMVGRETCDDPGYAGYVRVPLDTRRFHLYTAAP